MLFHVRQTARNLKKLGRGNQASTLSTKSAGKKLHRSGSMDVDDDWYDGLSSLQDAGASCSKRLGFERKRLRAVFTFTSIPCLFTSSENHYPLIPARRCRCAHIVLGNALKDSLTNDNNLGVFVVVFNPKERVTTSSKWLKPCSSSKRWCHCPRPNAYTSSRNRTDAIGEDNEKGEVLSFLVSGERTIRLLQLALPLQQCCHTAHFESKLLESFPLQEQRSVHNEIPSIPTWEIPWRLLLDWFLLKLNLHSNLIWGSKDTGFVSGVGMLLWEFWQLHRTNFWFDKWSRVDRSYKKPSSSWPHRLT